MLSQPYYESSLVRWEWVGAWSGPGACPLCPAMSVPARLTCCRAMCLWCFTCSFRMKSLKETSAG